MTGHWSNTRPNGAPIDAGTLCWVYEVPNGNDVYVYGKDMQEILDKMTRTTGNAVAARPKTPPPPPAAPRMTADQLMQTTADLQDPDKAGTALALLVKDATGFDLQAEAQSRFAERAEQWETENPDFYVHPGNQRLLIMKAMEYTGTNDFTRITKPQLSRAFKELTESGYLMPAPTGGTPPADGAQPTDPPPPTRSAFPGETPVQRTERPGQQPPRSTGTRSIRFGGSQVAPPKKPKYSEEDIRKMPLSKQRELIMSNDPDYAEACELYANQ